MGGKRLNYLPFTFSFLGGLTKHPDLLLQYLLFLKKSLQIWFFKNACFQTRFLLRRRLVGGGRLRWSSSSRSGGGRGRRQLVRLQDEVELVLSPVGGSGGRH